MAEHKHGDMDIETHEETFNGFVKAVTWMVGLIIFILIFMAVFNS